MASRSRVNTKFVVILSCAVLLIFGVVAYVGYSIVIKSGDDLARMGNEKMAEAERAEAAGDTRAAQQAYDAAQFLFSKAVNKERGNRAFLDLWRGAMDKWVPENQAAYSTAFDKYVALLRSTAILEGTSIPDHTNYLELLDQNIMLSSPSREGFEFLKLQTTEMLAYFDDDSGDVLRRYRGRAIVELIDNNFQVEEADWNRAREDLLAALKANPADASSAVALARLSLAESRRSRGSDRFEEADQKVEEARSIIASFIAENPGNAVAMLGQLQLDLDITVDEARRAAPTDPMAVRNAVSTLVPRLSDVLDALMATDAEKLDIFTIARFRYLESLLTPETRGSTTDRVLERALAAQPSSSDFLALRARISFDRKDFVKAIEQYQTVVTLPQRPVSLEGIRQYSRRIEALTQQAEASLGLWEQASTDEERARHVESARGYRLALSRELPADSPPLLLLDAKIAVCAGNTTEGQRLLVQYNERTGNNDIQGLWLLGQITSRTQPGVARQQFERILSIQPTNVPTIVALAAVESQLQNMARAIELYELALTQDPGNQAARTALEQARIVTGAAVSTDPVIQSLVEAGRVAQGTATEPGDTQQAIALLERALVEHDADLRIVSQLARLYLEREDLASTNRVVEAGLAKDPGNELLQRLKRGISSGDPVTAAITLIDESPDAPHIKAINKYRLYRSRGMEPEALAQLAEAERLAPDDRNVIESAFNEALSTRDFTQAQAVSERAIRLDLDRVGGLTYRARIASVQGNTADATRLFQQATANPAATPEIHRLLARHLVSSGRPQEAIAAYQRALSMRPDDIATINELLATLIRENDLNRALELARSSQNVALRNDVFENLWMDLEAAAGDKQLALERRTRITELSPNDRSNKISLASIMIELAQWDAARKLIDELRASEDSLQLVELDAKWYADQNNIDGARGIFVSYITDQDPETLTADAYIAFGRFMVQRGDLETGLSAITQGRSRQDKATLPADKELADTLFRAGRHSDAAPLYAGIVDANADTEEGVYRLRYIETLIRLERWDDAEAQIAATGARATTDHVLVLLRSSVARGKGDTRRQRELLDQAVALAPEDPLVYVERAQSYASDPALLNQALADLARAIQLRPGNWQALRIRASILAQQGRFDDAINDLKLALAANPGLIDLRFGLMLELVARDRAIEAVAIAEEGLVRRPSDLRLMLGSGQIFAQRGMWDRASQFYGRAFRQAQDISTAQVYLESLMNMTPPDLTEASNVLTRLGPAVASEPSLLIARAEVLAKRNRPDDARRELTAAYQLVRNNPRLIGAWYAGSRRVLSRPGEMNAYLENLEREVPDQWVTFLRAQTFTDAPATLSQGLEMLRRVQASENVQLSLLAFRTEGNALYGAERFAEAVEAWRRGLQKYGDDWEINNNVGFTLAKKLGKAEEAVPFAERAAQLNPDVPDIQDTLGVVYTAAARYDDAERALSRALELSRAGSDSQATILLHFALLEQARGNEEAARSRARAASDIVQASTTAPASLREEVQEVLRSVQ